MTVKRKIERIVSLVMEISPPDVKYNHEEKPVAFFNYSGHCACLSVQVHENGWKSDSDAEPKVFNVYGLHEKRWAKETNQKLDETIRYLEKLRKR